jgi:hypothetical protein
MSPFADGLQHPAVTGIAVSVASLPIAWLQQRLEVVEHQQARPLSQELEQYCSLRGFALGWHNPLVRQEADGSCQPLAGGSASRKLRQYTRWRVGATSWANRAASAVLPMPPMPRTAASRQRSPSTHSRRVASSCARPTNPRTSGASLQSRRLARSLSQCGRHKEQP